MDQPENHRHTDSKTDRSDQKTRTNVETDHSEHNESDSDKNSRKLGINPHRAKWTGMANLIVLFHGLSVAPNGAETQPWYKIRRSWLHPGLD